MGLDFKVRPGILIPRPDTEILVEAVIEQAKQSGFKKSAEMGLGSGCISISLAKYTDMICYGGDISETALETAKENAVLNDVADKTHFIHSDVFDSFTEEKFDIIVSNPPYFIDSLVCQEEKRKNARHTSSLSYENLIECAVKLLNDNGFICLITPSDVENHLDNIIMMNNCYVANKTYIRPLLGGEVKRLLWKISKHECACVVEYMEIEKSRHEYTDEYIALTREYYLKM